MIEPRHNIKTSGKNAKDKIFEIIFEADTPSGKFFDVALIICILLSVTTVFLESVDILKDEYGMIFRWIEWTFTLLFTLEYALRIFCVSERNRYIFSFYGIIDFLAIFPFYLRGAYDLRALRAFRIFRIFRALKLIRYNKALNRFHIAAKIVKEEIVLFLIVTSIFIFLASAGIYFFENKAQPEIFTSVIHSGWWAVVTLTTVGYGDVYPITVGGKIFTFFILLIGVGIVTIPAGLVASALSKAREIEEENIKKTK